MTILGIRDYIKDIFEVQRQPREDEATWRGHGGGETALEGQERSKRNGRTSGRALRINLVICSVTVWIMFVVAGVECAFAAMMQDDIKDDEYHSQCSELYVYQDYPSANQAYLAAKCHMLLAWTYIMIVAASFSLVRTLLQVLPVQGQNHLTINYRQGGATDNFLTPSRAYAIKTFFSCIAFILHVVSAIMLGVSPVISDKIPAAEEYHIGYSIGLAAVCASAAMTGHQTYATGLASWRLRG